MVKTTVTIENVGTVVRDITVLCGEGHNTKLGMEIVIIYLIVSIT